MNTSSASKRTLVDDSDSDYASPPPKKALKRKAPVKAKAAAPVARGPDVQALLELSRDQLDECDQAALVDTVVALQDAVVALQARVVAAQKEAPEMSPAQVEKAVAIQRKLMVKGIERQMTWKPSCKTGGAKFSFIFQIPRPVFLAVFSLPESFSKKNSHKLTMDDFETACGDQGLPEGKVRYDTLRISGNGVNIRRDEEESSVTVSGTYGK